jgi:flavin-dependent dehydrogenase
LGAAVVEVARADVVRVDVAIVGAGPAGSTLAALLAARGMRVALFDRDQFPRDKLCGEFLSYDALPILQPLGVLDAIDTAGAPKIEHCRIVGRKRTYEFALPHAARGVSRVLLDDLLLRTAAANGAQRRDGATVTGLEQLAVGGWRLAADRGEEIHATIVVGAWGRWGRFDQQLNRAFVKDRRHRNFGFKRHYLSTADRRPPTADSSISPTNPQPPTTNSRSATIALYAFTRGYLGVNDVEGHITNICGLVHASRLAGHKGKWDAFIETIRAEEPQLDALYASHEPAQDHYLTSEPVIFRARSAVEGGVFMIGDASGVLDPLTGNGMAMAIQSALLLAPFLLRLIAQPAKRAELEDEYRRAHRAFFASRIAWSRRAAMLLSRPRLLDAALRTVRSPRIGELFLRQTRGSREGIARMAEAWFR